MTSATCVEVFEKIETNVTAIASDDETLLDMVHELHLMILNSESSAFLVVPGDREDRVAFPVVEPTIRDVDQWHTHPQELQRFVYENLSVRVRVMFRENETHLPPRNENNSGTRVNLVCQLLEHEFTPCPPLQWFSAEEAVKRTQCLWDSDDPLDSIFFEAEDALRKLKGLPNRHGTIEAWHKMTWLSVISEWTKKTLDKEGYELVFGPISVHYGAVSHTMGCKAKRKQPANDGDDSAIEILYVKATVPELGEVQRTVAIAHECPDITGEIVAWDFPRGLMILRDTGSPSTYYVSPKAVFGTLQKLQSLSEGQLKRLEDGGVQVRDADWYMENIEGLLKALLKTDIMCDPRIIDALQYLNENVGTIKRMIRECNRWKLPKVLVHGDLHPGNYGKFVKEGEGGYHKLFDWDRVLIGSALIDVSATLWEPDFRFKKKLIDNLHELEMPWKGLIPESEWSVEFRRTTYSQYELFSCELLWYYLHVCEVRSGSVIWYNILHDFESRIMVFTRSVKEFTEDIKKERHETVDLSS